MNTVKFNEDNPIPPRSVVKWLRAPNCDADDNPDVGKVFRIGYYSKQDGLDVIWLVNDEARYGQTIDHEYLNSNFSILEISDETDFHGVNREALVSMKLN